MHHLVAGRKISGAALVADFHQFDPERLEMTLLGAQASERSGGVGIGVFERVQKIGSDRTHFIHGHVLDVAEHASLAGETDKKRSGADILTELEVFVKTHAVRLPVVPWPPY